MIAPDLSLRRGGVDSVSVLGLGLVDPRGFEVVPERHIRAQRGGADDAGQTQNHWSQIMKVN